GVLADPVAAVASYREALVVHPEDHRLLHRCLDIHVERKEWPQALAVLAELAAVEKVATVRARYRHAAAMIRLEELGEPEAARAALVAALDDDPTHAESASALETLLCERGAWQELANHHYRMLSHLGTDGAVGERLRRWSALGELCLERLGDRAAGLLALEAAANLAPTDLLRQQRLAQLLDDAG